MKKMANKILIPILIFLFIFCSGIIFTLFTQRNSQPIVHCFTPEEGAAVHPRNYCIMNPFRDKQTENIAENILNKLRNGQTEELKPYLTQEQQHILEWEKKYQITNWRVGNIEKSDNNLLIMYWVSRQNYNGNEEEAYFNFVRENDKWKLNSYSAIY